MAKSWDYLDKFLLSKIAIAIIKIYQVFSKLFPKTCRFYPSCSEYAYQAIIKKGFFYGGLLSLKRIVKCHPFSQGGHDPIE